MYWPDYSLRKRKTPIWKGLGVLVVLILIIFLVGEINGWWQISPSYGESQVQTVVGSEMTRDFVVVSETGEPTAQTNTPLPTTELTTTATPFRLSDLFDDSLTITLSDYAGRPVILNFWASWCVPCRTEMPALERVYQQYQEQGLVVLGINQLYIDNLQAAQDFVTELQLTFPNAVDETGKVSERDYSVLGLPTSVFITADGEITHTQVGQLKDEQLESFAEALVSGEEIIP